MVEKCKYCEEKDTPKMMQGQPYHNIEITICGMIIKSFVPCLYASDRELKARHRRHRQRMK